MNLAFNFHNKLFWIHNFLPQSLYKELYSEIFKKRKEIVYKDTGVNWRTYKEEVDDMSKSFDQDNEFYHTFFDRYHAFIKHQRFVNLINLKPKSHLRKYQYGEHLTWHSDEDKKHTREYAATFYFNHRWDPNWGGELMFKSEMGSGFIPVVGNSVVIVKTGLLHKVNPNLKKTHNRMSIQTWIDKD
jgi:Rps23 Pro-64 3,4-dihydroxylase Tpa1-like proline 4-hydroxylase